MTERLLVAIDDGYAQTKLVGANPNGGPEIRKTFRTSVRSGRYGLNALGGGAIGGYRTIEGEEFTVSDLIESENTQFDGFHTSTLNRVLIAHALAHSGYGGMDVELITGLPVADYFVGDGSIDVEKIDAKRKNLQLGVSSLSGSPLANIKTVEVGCQAVSAWLDYMLGDDLQYRREVEGKVAVVDIGGRTTDIALVVSENGSPMIDHSKSGTNNVGVLDVYKALTELLRTKFKIRDDIPLSILDTAVRTSKIKLFGKSVEIDDLVTDALKDVQGKIQREIDRRIGSAATLNAVVFVGGGSALLNTIAGSLANGVLAEDPEFANARGLLKYKRMLMKTAEAA